MTSTGNSTGFRDLSLSRFVFPRKTKSNDIFSQFVSRRVNEDGMETAQKHYPESANVLAILCLESDEID